MEEYKSKYTSKQRAVGELFYVFIVIACITSITGLVWSVFDFIMPEGKMDIFLALPLEYQIAIVAGFVAVLFFLLVFFFGLFKKGRKLITRYIFRLKEIEEKYKNRLDVKFAAGGLLVSILVIVVGILIALIQDVLSGSSTSPFSGFLTTFTGGNWVLFAGIALFATIGIVLFTIYFWKNGYYVILKMMGVLERED